MAAMTTSERPDAPTSSPRSRTVLVSFLGAVVRPMGNWMPIAGAVELMAELGFDAASVRTAVFRLKKRGWLVAEARGGARGYALTGEAMTALAAGDEIIWHARQPATLDGGWCVVSFSIPESARGQRHQLRSHLASLGFGNVSSAMWIAPARMQEHARRVIAELSLTTHCAVFVGDYVDGPDLSTLLHRSWDLDVIDKRYRAFIDHFGDRVHESDSSLAEPGDAFTTYLEVVDRWRRLPFRDPGLPVELLPSDWSGREAGALFERLVALLEGPALAHAARHWRTPASAV
jgi:phenylacetic acid degradation operon negative regulatory protein